MKTGIEWNTAYSMHWMRLGDKRTAIVDLGRVIAIVGHEDLPGMSELTIEVRGGPPIFITTDEPVEDIFAALKKAKDG